MMNSLDAITTFFGWATVINFVILTVATISIIAMRGFISGMHGKMFRLESVDLSRAYFQYLAQFKIATIVFSLTPYIALKFMA